MPVSRRAPSRLAAVALACVALVAAACNKAGSGGDAASKEVRVAAAADLAVAFREVGAAFEKKSGKKATFSFGSTGLLAKQLAEGARFDAFFAANQSFVDDVIKAGACDGATKAPYARGRIVVWTKKQGHVAAPASLADLADPRFAKIAIANPEHAPYGKAAREALTAAGVWDKVQPRIVFGENVQQTLQYAQTGNAEAAIVALSLAIATEGGEYLTVDEAAHKPIDQAAVVCTHGADAPGGREFLAFVASTDGRAIMQRFGFLLPGEAVGRVP